LQGKISILERELTTRTSTRDLDSLRVEFQRMFSNLPQSSSQAVPGDGVRPSDFKVFTQATVTNLGEMQKELNNLIVFCENQFSRLAVEQTHHKNSMKEICDALGSSMSKPQVM